MTNAVLSETYTLLLKRSKERRRAAVEFLQRARQGWLQIERTTEADEQKAEGILLTHADKTYSYCDALSFAVMERLGVREAISFDDDFRSYGKFRVL